MFLASRILFLYVETPLHAGTGSGLGAVDLPIQRERTTGYPIVQASGIKGALKSNAPDGAERTAVFGPDNADHAGAVSPGDARILLFPVRSLKGVFAWVTCVDVLERFRRDAQLMGLPELPQRLGDPEANKAYASGAEVMTEDQTVVLEEFAFTASVGEKTAKWAKWFSDYALPQVINGDKNLYAYWQTKLLNSLVILPNDAFRDFVAHSTEVITRVRLDPDTKTVVEGALWTEEHLPTDSILYTPIHATRVRMNGNAPASFVKSSDQEQATAVLDWLANTANVPHLLQLGGDETVGRGLVRLRWTGGA